MSDDSLKLMVEQMDSSYQLSFVFDSEAQALAPEAINMVSVASTGLNLICSDHSDTPVASAKVIQFSRPSAATPQSRNSNLVDRILNSIRLYN